MRFGALRYHFSKTSQQQQQQQQQSSSSSSKFGTFLKKMSTYSSKHKQRERILAQFVNFTQSNEKNAINFLSQHDWKLDLAVDAYFLSTDSSRSNANRSSTSAQVDRKKLDQIWTLYKGFFLHFVLNTFG